MAGQLDLISLSSEHFLQETSHGSKVTVKHYLLQANCNALVGAQLNPGHSVKQQCWELPHSFYGELITLSCTKTLTWACMLSWVNTILQQQMCVKYLHGYNIVMQTYHQIERFNICFVGFDRKQKTILPQLRLDFVLDETKFRVSPWEIELSGFREKLPKEFPNTYSMSEMKWIKIFQFFCSYDRARVTSSKRSLQ